MLTCNFLKNTIFFSLHLFSFELAGLAAERPRPAEHGDARVTAARQWNRRPRTATPLPPTRDTGHSRELQPGH